MAFQSLYRKHRPQRFDEMVGQAHVTAAIRNAVRDGRTGHAYLFSGPRGTGKTTVARILAKALNCADRLDSGEPCSACDSCVEIARGASMDVIELDAASNNKVDEMRELLSRVAYRSAGGRWRVYIVDEVHMLTKGASNALLKTLEEPPDHVVFVLATTEPEAVLPTIRSRTQHFEFRLYPVDEVVEHLAQVAGIEGLDVDDETLRLVARRGGGSMRDALSLLDQAVALGEGELGAEQVRALFDATPFQRVASLLDAVAAEDVAGVLSELDSLLEGGAGARQVADDLLAYLRDVFVVSASRGEARVDALGEELEQLRAHGEALGGSAVMRAIETLGDAAVDMRRAPDPRLVLEVALVRITRRQAGTPVEALLDRVERLEKAVAELRAGGQPSGAAPSGPAPSGSAPSAPSAPPEAPAATVPPGERPALGAVRGEAGEPPAPAQEPAATREEPEPATREEPEREPALQPEPASQSEPAQQSAAEGPERQPEGAADTAHSAEPAGGTPADSAAGPADVELDDVILAWPEALSKMRPVLKAIAREAQPLSVDGGTVVLGLPDNLARHRERLERDAGQVADVLGAAVGGTPLRIRVEVHEGFLGDTSSKAAPAQSGAGDGGAGGDDAGAAASEPPNGAGGVGEEAHDEPREELPEIDPDRSAEAPAGGLDSVERLKDAFDARVEDDG